MGPGQKAAPCPSHGPCHQKRANFAPPSRARSKVAFCFKSSPHYMYFALDHYKDNCCLCWLCTVTPVRGSKLHVIKLDMSLEKPMLQVVWDLDNMTTGSYKIVSYSGVWTQHASLRQFLQPGLPHLLMCFVIVVVVHVLLGTSLLLFSFVVVFTLVGCCCCCS